MTFNFSKYGQDTMFRTEDFATIKEAENHAKSLHQTMGVKIKLYKVAAIIGGKQINVLVGTY